eukprot:TRINITY_DN38945_c0_g1_i1.p1 TRINITY_DN38945_c0_g1~~TRINITY_DN38945_c0_g1_i1.p1  ORF type:complete len:155 (-),score=27.53 TRINITY_DN38945_c0_g1_i1:55-477(-)
MVVTTFLSLPWCGPFLARPSVCLEQAVKELLDAAHYSSHAAGMIAMPSTKLHCETTASRSAEAADLARAAADELKRQEEYFVRSMGPGALLLAVAQPPRPQPHVASSGRHQGGSSPKRRPEWDAHNRCHLPRTSCLADFL